MRYCLWPFLLLGICITAGSAWAVELGRMQYREAPAGSSMFPTEAASWKTLPLGKPLHPGITTNVYWLQAEIAGENFIDDEYALLVTNCLPDTLDAYQAAHGNMYHYQGGDRRAYSLRTVPSRFFVVPLRSTEPVQIRMASHDGLHEPVNIRLIRLTEFSRSSLRENLFYGAYFGALAVVAVLSALFGLLFREKNQLVFAAYGLVFCLWSLTFHGFSDPLLWPDWPISNQVMMFSVYLFTALQTLFAIRFLRLPQHHPDLARTLWGLLILVSVLLPPLAWLDSYRIFFMVYIVVTLVSTSVLLLSGALVARRGDVRGWFFLASWSVLLVGGVLYMLKAMGLVPSTPLTEQMFFVGNLVQIIVLGLALNLRYQQSQLLTNLTLERMVATRTADLKKANRQLKLLAQRDSLTGLFNRRHFEELFRQQEALHQRKQMPLSLLMLDIDFFKQFNDTYGHVAGDQCLAQVAGKLQRSVPRASDFCARYGGEEFIVCLGGTDEQGCFQVADRLRQAVEELAITHAGSKVAAHVTISIGCATSPGASPLELHTLKERADQALYQAKKNGRNRVELFS
jgi:two-component system, sensor histidine kinase LadS